MAQTVGDAALLYHALLGEVAAATPPPIPVSGLRLAVPRPYFCDLLDDDVRSRFEEALERLKAAGARISDIELHHAADIVAVYMHISFADAAAYHAVTLDSMPERSTEPV